ncbi:iron chaperone [Stackebrandtia nassauensis]|uniref:YdhG-like domain-containing protein n=1 Tax=Stackebrandtia nassauensis (strain DSM 44728 / CIP 108903 / NRRL B-16338 / NBRC 102104 / LLR-40K-21) TaxID=446470 RepID=D3Q5X0_STANL|nr:DUF1801 domain-containing protein [Stackebrandtia nassauensis]ADD40269.1 Domain of unknown function DUF1801 [Stackebrandtia nassauensis DSM 44728]
MATAKKSAKQNSADGKYVGFDDAEKAAMKERAAELKKETKRGAKKSKDGEADVLAKIAEMPEEDRVIAEGIHALMKEVAPQLTSKTWYGMPAYAKDGKNVCFFQAASKFKVRYATFGFEVNANLDDGTMWPTSFAVTEWNDANRQRIAALVKQAVG